MDGLEELTDAFPALSRYGKREKLARLDAQSDDDERCDVFTGESCADVIGLSDRFNGAVSCRCLRELKAAARPLENDGLTASIREMTFGGYEPRTVAQQRALTVCRAFAGSIGTGVVRRCWIVLHGPPGVGKTHLAVSVMNEVESPFFVSWPSILDELRAIAGRRDAPYPEHIWDTLYRPGLLVVDDFDKDVESTWAEQRLYRVVNHRYNLQLPTVWTANTQVVQSVGPVGSRLRDKNLSNVLHVTGPDYRTEGGS